MVGVIPFAATDVSLGLRPEAQDIHLARQQILQQINQYYLFRVSRSLECILERIPNYSTTGDKIHCLKLLLVPSNTEWGFCNAERGLSTTGRELLVPRRSEDLR